MNYEELLLKTAFCTMACDGNIAQEEIQCIKDIVKNFGIEKVVNVNETLNKYIAEINVLKGAFLDNYINELSNQQLTKEQELQLAKLAIGMILVDEVIEYYEIKFFKRIRSKLKCDDEQIKKILPDDSKDPNMPTQDDFLSQDIICNDDFWDNVTFEIIKLESPSLN